MANLFGTYLFTDFIATINGPNGAFTIGGPETAQAEEGVTIGLTEETNTQTIGADGSVMNSMHASKAGTATIRLQKISPVNAQLSQMYNLDRLSSATWAQNVITLTDIVRGDNYTCQGCAFTRYPNNAYAKIGNMIEWEFHISVLDPSLGPGVINVA